MAAALQVANTMAIVLILLSAPPVMATDIAGSTEPSMIISTDSQGSQSPSRALIIGILQDGSTDLAPAYAAAFEANGRPADIIYDPSGLWPDMWDIGWCVMSTSDVWWDSYDWSADMHAASSFIDNGRCFWLIGQDFLYASASQNGLLFLQTYFGVDSISGDVIYDDPSRLVWEGTDGGPLEGLSGALLPCFTTVKWRTDEVIPTFQGLVTWQTDGYGPAEGGSATDFRTLFSTVEFGCDPETLADLVGALMYTGCGMEIPGACCQWWDGSCCLSTSQFCDGAWLGQGVPCDPNPCPQPQGACCQADGSCQVTEETECPEGDWLGRQTDCDPNPCFPPTLESSWGRIKERYRRP